MYLFWAKIAFAISPKMIVLLMSNKVPILVLLDPSDEQKIIFVISEHFSFVRADGRTIFVPSVRLECTVQVY